MGPAILKLLAWCVLAAIAAVTLSPIGWRPRLPIDVSLERISAYVFVGFLFSLAYSRHIWLAAAIVIAGACSLELLQMLLPERHGRLDDAAIKVAGACVGLGVGWLVAGAKRRRNL